MSTYQSHKAFVAPALASNGLVWLVLGFATVELLYWLGYVLLDMLLLQHSPVQYDAFYLGASFWSLFAQLMSFSILGGAVVLIVWLIHRRGPLSLIGNLRRAIPQFAFCFALLIVLLIALEFVPPWWSFDTLESMRPLPTWLAMLPIALFAILIQISAEELFYRGYVQQQIAARFAHPLVWILVPSLLFGFAHWDSGSEILQNVQYVVWAFFFGLAASDLTGRSGTLGPALALHLANNAFAFMLYAEHKGPSSGFALFLFPTGSMGEAFEAAADVQSISWQLFVELSVLFVMWLIARLALKR